MYNVQKNDLNKTVGRQITGSTHSYTADYGYEALGVEGTQCVIYSHPLKQIVHLKASDMTEIHLTMVIGHAEAIRLVQQFMPGVHELGKSGTKILANKIISECQEKGPFGKMSVRGHGVWSDEDGNILINGYNLIDIDGNNVDRRSESYIYLAEGPYPYFPDTIEATTTEAKAIYDLYYTFMFSNRKTMAHRMLGLLGCFMLPGVLSWRPSGLITGPSGLGKSTLSSITEKILGNARSERYSGKESSVAGIRDKIKNKALAIMLDEMEASYTTSLIINYLRSSSEGITGIKSSSSMQANSYSGRACFLMGGINPPKLEDADYNRLVFLDIVSTAEKMDTHWLFPDGSDDNNHLLARIGNGLFARLIRRSAQLKDLILRIKKHMISKGFKVRIADTYSGVIACAWIFLHDEELLESEMDSFIDVFDIKEREESGSKASDMFQAALNTIIKDSDSTTTINYMLRDYVKASIDKNTKYAKLLAEKMAMYCIRPDVHLNVDNVENSKLTIFIHGHTNKQFSNLTSERNSDQFDLESILMQQPGATKVDKPMRVGGLLRRVVKIPMCFNNYYESDDKENNDDLDFGM